MEVVIKMTNKIFYSFVVVVVCLFVGVGVYAFTDDNSGNPRVMGHSPDEMGIPTRCVDGQVLKVFENVEGNLIWGCDSETVLPVCVDGQVLKAVDGVWTCGSDKDTHEVNTYEDLLYGDFNVYNANSHIEGECLFGLGGKIKFVASQTTCEGNSCSETPQINICETSGTTCPSKWGTKTGWTTTIPRTCTCDSKSYTTGSHDFSTEAVETLTYYCGGTRICRAVVTHVGCY
ncbi:hypothetical protein KAS08_05755 [Candidatus Pacearchaeota archaeon]|nr:hypothetical protein [Candidatus Pacearchaeota archaeon]